MIVQRLAKPSAAGCFSEVLDDDGSHVMFTAEHAYQQPDGSWAPKVVAGTYTCVRGDHQIHVQGKLTKINTFEVQGVAGHSGILFVHVGNWPQKDSDGCSLAGTAIGTMAGMPALEHSNVAVNLFAVRMHGIDTLQLEVKEAP